MVPVWHHASTTPPPQYKYTCAYEKFISGASYVQLYTGMVYQGPNIVNKISEELNEILSSDGVKNIEEIIGSK